MSAANRDESLDLGMSDTLITILAGLKDLRVRPTSAVRKYSDLAQDALAAGREQKVDAVLEGTLQTVGDRIRVNVRLLNVSDGRQLWSGMFDEKSSEIFRVQNAISSEVTNALAQLNANQSELVSRRSTTNVEAYNLYVKGYYFWHKRTAEDLRRAIDYYKQALNKDPNYARAYLGLAETYVVLSNHTDVSQDDSLALAKSHAQKAIE